MNDLIKKFLDILGKAFWTFIVFLIIFWYIENRKEFFPNSPLKNLFQFLNSKYLFSF